MTFPTKQEDCHYHNSPKEYLHLDDGTVIAVTKSVLTGTPLLAVYGTKSNAPMVSFPISHCPFCGASLLPNTYKLNTSTFYGLTKEAAEFALENHRNVYSQYTVDMLVTKLREAEERLAQYEDGR